MNILQLFYRNFAFNVGASDSYVRGTSRPRDISLTLQSCNWLSVATYHGGTGQRDPVEVHSTLEDLDYAYDVALLSYTHIDTYRRKRIGLTPLGNRLDWQLTVINRGLHTSGIEWWNKFADTLNYLGATICCDGGASSDICKRLSKARSTFARLKQVCKSSQYSRKTS